MKTSVVLSTYNGEQYIIEQLESIKNQTRIPDEVLIYDDCSTDQTVELVRNFIDKNRLDAWKLEVNQHNKGWKKNFMNGIWSASGDLVFPCDQDDIWMPHKIATMEKIIEDNSSIMVLTSGYEAFYDSGKTVNGPIKPNGKLEKQQFSEKIFSIRYPGCTYCIRKSFVEISKKHWQFDFPHDAMFWRMGMFSDTLYSYNESLIHWRKHQDSTFTKESNRNRTFSKKKDSLDYAMRVVNDLEDFVNEYSSERRKEKIEVLEKEKKWIEIRKEFYSSKKPLCGIKLLRYIRCYDRIRQYCGDWYLIYGKKN